MEKIRLIFRCKENLSEKLADFEQEKEKRKSSADSLDAFLELIASSERVLAELDNSSSSPASNALEKIQVFFFLCKPELKLASVL